MSYDNDWTKIEDCAELRYSTHSTVTTVHTITAVVHIEFFCLIELCTNNVQFSAPHIIIELCIKQVRYKLEVCYKYAGGEEGGEGSSISKPKYCTFYCTYVCFQHRVSIVFQHDYYQMFSE